MSPPEAWSKPVAGCPKISEKTTAARKHNDRVQFLLVEQDS